MLCGDVIEHPTLVIVNDICITGVVGREYECREVVGHGGKMEQMIRVRPL
jgi:hypothetical protein